MTVRMWPLVVAVFAATRAIVAVGLEARDVAAVARSAVEEAARGELDGFVKIKVATTARRRAAAVAGRAAAAMGCGEARRVFRHAGIHEAAHAAAGLDRWYETECQAGLRAAGTGVRPLAERAAAGERTLRSLARLDTARALVDVAAVAPGRSLRKIGDVAGAVDDPLRGDQTHFDTIDLDGAWAISTGRPEVVVAVVDTGMEVAKDGDDGHPDLQKNIWTNAGEICGNGVDDDKNGYVDDCHGYNFGDDTGEDLLGDGSHGSHCAGTIAADSGNGMYVSGVAGGAGDAAGVSLQTLVVFGASFYQGFGEALVYGADHGARVSSNSWGYTSVGVYDQDVLDAIDYADAKGSIVVFAAGNNGDDGAWYPAYYDPVVAVAATDDDKVAPGFTCYGDWVDISAPGEDQLSTVTVSDGTTGRMSGTSMACPVVAGVLALGASIDPTRTNEELLECLHSTAMSLNGKNEDKYKNKLGSGLVHASEFAECVQNGAPSVSPTLTVRPSPEPTTPSPTLTFSPTAYGCGICNIDLVISILTDTYPSETTWAVSWENPGDCRGDATASGGPYVDPFTRHVETVAGLCEGYEYTFTIMDTFGDGICCAEGDGSYALFINDVPVGGGAEFFMSETVSFVATGGGTGAPSLTPAPTTWTPSTQPTTPKPTYSMTDCEDWFLDFVGDGICDDWTVGDSSPNSDACAWDGGDCCPCTCVPVDSWDCKYGMECEDPAEKDDPSCDYEGNDDDNIWDDDNWDDDFQDDDVGMADDDFQNDDCLDSTSWYKENKPSKTCEEATSNSRCESWVDENGTPAFVACPYTCDSCGQTVEPTRQPTKVPAPAPTDASTPVKDLEIFGVGPSELAIKWRAKRDVAFALALVGHGEWVVNGATAGGDGAWQTYYHVFTAAHGLWCDVSYVVRVDGGQGAVDADVATAPCDDYDAEDDGAGDCADSTSWFNKKTSRDCGYVAKKTSKRCDLEAEDGVSGFEGCRETCGGCDGGCEDSTSWFNKKTSRDCGYVAKKTKNRCDLEAEDGVSGFEGCRETCGDCR